MTYNKAVALLSEAGIENAETDAAILFEHFAGIAIGLGDKKFGGVGVYFGVFGRGGAG